MRRPSLKGLVLEAVLCADMPIACIQPESICEENFFSEGEFPIYTLAPYSFHYSKSLLGFCDSLASNYIHCHGTVVADTAICNRYPFARFNQPILLILHAMPARYYLDIKSCLLFLPKKLLSGDG